MNTLSDTGLLGVIGHGACQHAAWILPVLLGLFVTSMVQAQSEPAGLRVRRPYLAGSWYPGSAKELRDEIEGYLKNANVPALPGPVIGVVSPHAGYQFSGQSAAYGYKALKGQEISRVILLAFSHRYPIRGLSVLDCDAYRTPLGDIPLDADACKELRKNPLFRSVPEAEPQENSHELQLPFLQCVLPKFKLVPVLVGQLTADNWATAAKELGKLVDDHTVIVASSDFTHYGPAYDYVPFTEDVKENLRKLDMGAADLILKLDTAGFQAYIEKTGATICGRAPILMMMAVLQGRPGIEGKVLNYDSSGRISGDYTRQCVDYVSLVFWRTASKSAAKPQAEQK